MATNRILQHLRCDCCRQRRRDDRLKAIAEDLADRMASELVSIEAYEGEMHAAILASWEIDDPSNAGAELAELLREVAHNLTAAAERIGGAS